ncbi:MAG: TIGR03067 domain-containing protein [Thermoguttaceae bacterium]
MRHSYYCPILLAAGLLVLIGGIPCRGETAQDDKQAEQSIIGPWNPDSVAILENGVKKTMPRVPQKPISVVIAEKEITMRVGDQKFAEMPYSLDSTQSPAAIDVKFQGQDMPGIWALNGDRLKISLNEAKKGRPTDFGAADNDMDLVLHRYTGQPLFVIGADGSDLHQLPSTGEYLSCSSPKWSRDGKIAYYACRTVFGENWRNGSHIFTIDADGSSPKDLGDGSMPSWSPDGKQIAFSRYATGGVWIMDADGSNKKLIEDNVWSVDWSPKNQDEVAYIASADGPGVDIRSSTDGKIVVRNLKTNEVRTLLDKDFSSSNWSLAWSPDGRWLCYQAETPDGEPELAIVSAEGQSKGFKVLLPNDAIKHIKESSVYFSWRPDGKRLLTSIKMDGDDNRQLYLLDVEGKELPQKLAGQDPSRNNVLSCWSADGKKIVFASGPTSRPEP